MKTIWLPLFILKILWLSFYHISTGSEKPNFVVIISESHSTSAVGAYKGYLSDINPTPNLDLISQKGSIFTNAFCTNATSGPSTASILTGKYSHLNGFIHNGCKFNTSQNYLPKILKELGYQTALFGRWDLGVKPKYFDNWSILTDPTEKYNPEFLNTKSKKRIEGHSTDIISDLALDWLHKKKNVKPFFLLIQFNATNKPWMPAIRHLRLYDDKLLPEPINLIDEYIGKASPARYQSMEIKKDLDLANDLFFPSEQSDRNRSKKMDNLNGQKNLDLMTPEQHSAWKLSWRPKNEAFLRENHSNENILHWKFQRFTKNYLRCISGIDENVKRINELLTATNKTDSFLIYTSNHGRFLGEHGWFGSKWIYEESSKVPLIIRMPFGLSSTNTVSSLVQNIDLAQTILDYAGLKEVKEMQGESVSQLLDNEDSNNTWRNSIYFHHNEFPGDQMIAKHYGIRTLRHKLIHFYQFDEWEFYDLENDPNESKNLYGKENFSSELEKMKQLLVRNRTKYLDDSDISIMPEEWRKIYRGPEARKE
ncbi:MAG: sulfatase-like hydrolase/transferase [Opitutales bacterium]|nr:sulfatase-like hydrolase/transferase [Opitutales bacterium]